MQNNPMPVAEDEIHALSQKPSEARDRILDAALVEFAERGLAGARMDAIAAAAQVNKALIYYYFHSKDDLYLATLTEVTSRMRAKVLGHLNQDASPGESFLRFAIDHFDRITAERHFQAMLQQEMVRVHRGESTGVAILVEQFFRPMQLLMQQMLEQGIASGELVPADWSQFLLAAIGANVFYFLTAPMARLSSGQDPLTPSALAHRRRLLVEYLGLTVFTDRAHGARLAAHVLATHGLATHVLATTPQPLHQSAHPPTEAQ